MINNDANKKPQRKSNRLKDYDYSLPGAYFVTICTQNKIYLFGNIINTMLQLNDAGKMINRWWQELNNKFDDVKTDEYVVMPNHFHGIIIITESIRETHIGVPLQNAMQWFKTMTTNEYIRNVKQSGWTPFVGKLWQRSYYDHISRNEGELNLIRQYIIDNPSDWSKDKYHINITP
jgi:putative transposase